MAAWFGICSHNLPKPMAHSVPAMAPLRCPSQEDEEEDEDEENNEDEDDKKEEEKDEDSSTRIE